jgi:hypothetical protein
MAPAQFFVDHVDDSTPIFSGGGVYDGTSVVCLSVDDPGAVTTLEGAYKIEGRAISDTANTGRVEGNLVPCAQEPMRLLEVRDASGQHWTLGYSWTSSDGWDLTPAVGIRSGEAISLTVRADPDSDAAGFVVLEGDDLIYAMESGIGGQGLIADDLGLLDVTDGTEVTTTTGDCGEERTYVSLDFTSDDDRERLGPNGDGTLVVDGDYYTVCNITSYSVTSDPVTEAAEGCAESGETSWMLFR